MLGDGPERPIRRRIDERDRCMGPQIAQRNVKPLVVGVGGRIGQYPGGVIDGQRAHRFSSRSALLSVSTIGGACVSLFRQPRAVVFDRVRFARRLCLVILVIPALTLWGCGATQPAQGTLVRTVSGALRGAFADDHLLFAGIPYAAPPVGPLRWRPPQPPASWQGVRDASKAGPRCVQNTRNDPDGGRSVSEDCLTVNVWTPLKRAGTPRPVMVWIHGGAFTNGSGDMFDARWLVKRGDIIVVTINYRLGALGFLADPSLA